MSLGFNALATRPLATQDAPPSPPSGPGDFAMSLDGETTVTATGNMPEGINTLEIAPGGLDGNTRWKIKRIRIFRGVLTAQELELLTGG